MKNTNKLMSEFLQAMKNCTKTQLVIYNSSSMKKNASNLCDLLKAAYFLCKLAQVMSKYTVQ